MFPALQANSTFGGNPCPTSVAHSFFSLSFLLEIETVKLPSGEVRTVERLRVELTPVSHEGETERGTLTRACREIAGRPKGRPAGGSGERVADVPNARLRQAAGPDWRTEHRLTPLGASGQPGWTDSPRSAPAQSAATRRTWRGRPSAPQPRRAPRHRSPPSPCALLPGSFLSERYQAPYPL